MNKKIKRLLPYIGVIVWVSILSYIFGILNRPIPNGEVTMDLNRNILNKIPNSDDLGQGRDEQRPPSMGQYFASINGTKYYPTSCRGSKRVKEENRVWFESEDEAKEAGYEAAKGC